jgi:anti-anti-sigma factor
LEKVTLTGIYYLKGALVTTERYLIPGFTDEQNDALKVHLEVPVGVPGCIRVIPVGMIDAYSTQFWTKQLEKVVNAKDNFQTLWIDCAGVSYMSSVGVGSFIDILKRLRLDGKDMIISGIQSRVFQVFKLLGFSQFFEIYSDAYEAEARLKAGPPVSAFPKIKRCPICSRQLKLVKSGRFRCSGTNGCNTVLAVSVRGDLTLG